MKRRLGNLEVSPIGLGCMGMSHAYGLIPERRSMIELIAEAVETGYTFFDTAEVYGTDTEPHHNEVLIGEALAPFRYKVKISTKFGLSFDFSAGRVPFPLIPDSKPETIRKAVEGSLRRLRTDYIDLYFQHRIDPEIAPEEVASVMADLIKEGKILHWGVSEAPEEYIRRAHKACPLTAIEHRYSMMARWYERLFPMLEDLGIGFVAYSPLANGLLSDKYTTQTKFDDKNDYRAAMPQFTEEGFEKNRLLLELIRHLSKEKNATPAQISLAWMLCKKPYIVPIPGTRKKERMKENFGAVSVSLSAEEIERIDAVLDAIPMSEVFGETRKRNRRF